MWLKKCTVSQQEKALGGVTKGLSKGGEVSEDVDSSLTPLWVLYRNPSR